MPEVPEDTIKGYSYDDMLFADTLREMQRGDPPTEHDPEPLVGVTMEEVEEVFKKIAPEYANLRIPSGTLHGLADTLEIQGIHVFREL